MDRTAWKVDDKAWVKERKKKWKKIKESLNRLDFLKKSTHKVLKSFYLTGEFDPEDYMQFYWEEVDPDKPMEFIGGIPVLLECWLTADQSEKNWQGIRDKYKDRGEAQQFMEIMEMWADLLREKERYISDGGTPFGHLEKRLYQLLCETRCLPGSYPQITNHEKFKAKAIRVWQEIQRHILLYLNSAYSDVYHPVLDRLQEYRDALDYMKDYPADFTDIIAPLERMVKYPDYWPVDFTAFAKKILAVYADPTLPQIQLDRAAKSRQKVLPFVQQVVPGSRGTLFVECDNAQTRDNLCRYLIEGEKKNVIKKLTESEFFTFKALVEFRPLRFLEKLGETGMLFQVDFRFTGHNEVWWLANAFNDNNCQPLYAYFDCEDPAPAYYNVNAENGMLKLVYQPGENSGLDEIIQSFDEPGKAIPDVIKYLANKNDE